MDSDLIIEKPHFDAFAYTNLLDILRKNYIETVLVTGVRTELCVDASAKRAASEGFRTILVSDLVSTYDDKQELQQSVLDFFSKYYGYSLSSDKVLKLLSTERF